MDWNPTSLNPPAHHHHHPVTSHYPSYHGMSTAALSAGGLSAGKLATGSSSGIADLTDNLLDDRRPATPRNLSPAILAQEYGGDDGLAEENHDDLLVFGYGCKIFRDDERAKWIEEEKHLIPWMGNQELLIDRYDCRGALMDIKRYEPGSGYDNSQEEDVDNLNSSYEQEKMMEQELDAERYRELNENVDYDEGAYDKAADYRRLQSAMNGMLTESSGEMGNERNYTAFQYDYNAQNHDICIGPEPKRVLDEDAPYQKPVGLYIPEEIILPSTMKVHAIIEKTAKFIASQGNQMEIILKTKQASNPLFDFLTHGGNLNPYYKFIVHAIRSGIYRPPATEQEENSSNQQDGNQSFGSECGSEEDSEHHTYLHPSLFRNSNLSSTTSTLSTIDYTTAASLLMSSGSASNKHNKYSMLVSKIKGTDSPDPTVSQQQQPLATSANYATDYQAALQNQQDNVYGYNLSSQQQQQMPAPAAHKKLPSPADQLIIEKMASYVIKNGANFEVLAKNKSDPRFGFLNPLHDYHWYYLNCKERFKAECTAVVASSEFVNYSSSSGSSTLHNNIQTGSASKSSLATATSSSSTIKRAAVAAELAELKRKIGGLTAAKKDKTGTGSGTGTGGGSGGAETVFSQASLIQSKEKDKPLIRFSSSLGLTTPAPNAAVAAAAAAIAAKLAASEKSSSLLATTKEKQQLATREKAARDLKEAVQKLGKGSGSTSIVPVASTVKPVVEEDEEEEEEGEIRDTPNEDSDSDLYILDQDDQVGGTSSPASENDEEKKRRRLERKRKATIFLQRLKMAKAIPTTGLTTFSGTTTAGAKVVAAPKPVSTGTSLGDLLSKRLQSSAGAAGGAAQQERIGSGHHQIPPEITLSDSEDNNGRTTAGRGANSAAKTNASFDNKSDSSKSASSSGRRSSSRGRSRNHATASSSSRSSRKRRKKRSSRSYSPAHSGSRSSSSGSSYEGSGNHSRKKSKKKRKKKKKKHEKSSRSSHKSKRR